MKVKSKAPKQSGKHTHTCIKCLKSYSDNEVEAYYCGKCNEEKKAIAQRIDQEVASRPKKEGEASELQGLLSDPRTIFKNNGHSIFIRESQL